MWIAKYYFDIKNIRIKAICYTKEVNIEREENITAARHISNLSMYLLYGWKRLELSTKDKSLKIKMLINKIKEIEVDNIIMILFFVFNFA